LVNNEREFAFKDCEEYFLKLDKGEKVNVSSLCRQLKISRVTFYKRYGYWKQDDRKRACYRNKKGDFKSNEEEKLTARAYIQSLFRNEKFPSLEKVHKQLVARGCKLGKSRIGDIRREEAIKRFYGVDKKHFLDCMYGLGFKIQIYFINPDEDKLIFKPNAAEMIKSDKLRETDRWTLLRMFKDATTIPKKIKYKTIERYIKERDKYGLMGALYPPEYFRNDNLV
jgi:hypothetical protein